MKFIFLISFFFKCHYIIECLYFCVVDELWNKVSRSGIEQALQIGVIHFAKQLLLELGGDFFETIDFQSKKKQNKKYAPLQGEFRNVATGRLSYPHPQLVAWWPKYSTANNLWPKYSPVASERQVTLVLHERRRQTNLLHTLVQIFVIFSAGRQAPELLEMEEGMESTWQSRHSVLEGSTPKTATC